MAYFAGKGGRILWRVPAHWNVGRDVEYVPEKWADMTAWTVAPVPRAASSKLRKSPKRKR